MTEQRRSGAAADFFRGLHYLPRAMQFLRKHPGLLKYVALPFLINVVAFSLAGFLGLKMFGRVVDYLPQGDAWYYLLLYGLLWVFAVLVVLVLVFFTFTVIGNLIAAPFNGLLSERVETLLSGTLPDVPFRFKEVLRDAGRSMLVEAKKIAVFIFGMLMLLLLNLLPLVGTFLYAATALLLTLSFLAWEYLSFVHERKQLDFSGQYRYLLKRKALLLGFACGVMTLLAIPFIQLLCIPLAVIGATMLWCEERRGEAPSPG